MPNSTRQKPQRTPDPADKDFGKHIRSCRKARGLTQDVLAEKADLAADTIRRLEHGSFSPSLYTLRKVSRALNMRLGTLFDAYEVGERDVSREITDVLSELSFEERRQLLRLLVALRRVLAGGAA